MTRYDRLIHTPFNDGSPVYEMGGRMHVRGREWATGMRMTDMGDDHIVHLHRWLTHQISLGKDDLYTTLQVAKDINALKGEIERRGLEVIKAKLGKKKKRVKLFE